VVIDAAADADVDVGS